MTLSAMLPATAVRPVLDYVDRMGMRRSPRMERVGARLGDPGLLLPFTVAAQLFDDAIRAGGGEDVGLQIGSASRLERIGAFGEQLRRAPTIAAGLALAVRQRHNSGERFVLQRRGAEMWFQRHVTACVQRGRAQERDFALLITIQFLRLAAGPRWRPLEIHLEGPPPPHADRLAELALRGLRFGAPQTVIVFPARLMALPLPPVDPECAEGERMPVAPTGFVGSLRATVESLVQIGEIALATAAEATGTSPRSLQRHLAGVGLNFADLVDEVRFRMASEFLRDPRAKVMEVAAELGYTDSANFTRAFRRWTGVSPQSFRRSLSEPVLSS